MTPEKEGIKNIVRDDKGLKTFIADKEAVAIGDGAHVLVPKELKGKIIRICYDRDIAEGRA